MAEKVDVVQGHIFSEETDLICSVETYLIVQKPLMEINEMKNSVQKCIELSYTIGASLTTFGREVLRGTNMHGLDFIKSDIKSLFLDIYKFKSSTKRFEIDLNSVKQVDAALYDLKSALKDLRAYFKSLETISIQSPCPYSALPKELSNYINVGNEMKESAEIVKIRDELKKLKVNHLPSIYLALVGPSYMGKTQSAFTLSHSINVFYVNLQIALFEYPPQKIYSPFENISRIFKTCVDFDTIGMREEDNTTFHSDKIRQSNLPLQTLGLIYTLLKLKKLKSGSSTEDWYMFYINLASVVFPKLTATEFNQKIDELGRDFLENSVIFIDELSEMVFDPVQALRNICRAVDLPCILSGTNSKVQNLVGIISSQSSRSGPPLPWVKVATKLPKASLKALAHFVKVKSWKENGSQLCLGSFVDGEGWPKIEALIDELIDVRTLSQDGMRNESALGQDTLGELKQLVQFTLNQSKSNLPGLAILSLQSLFDCIVELRSNPPSGFTKALWNNTLTRITNMVRMEKPLLAECDGQLASAHILTFPENMLKSDHEEGHAAARKVESHLFYFGACGAGPITELSVGTCIDIFTQKEKAVLFDTNERKWKDGCHFSDFCDDFFAHIIAWNSWWRKVKLDEFSLAAIYEKYLNDSFNFSYKSKAIFSDSFALELLAHWSIAYASHQNIHGETKGVDLLWEFIKNIQKPSQGYAAIFVDPVIPEGLESFLGRIAVPYLVPEHSLENTAFVNGLKPFLQLGKSWRPGNSAGFDVLFDIKLNLQDTTASPLETVGHIECKLWTDPVYIGTVYTYYERACKSKSPLTFLVCKEFSRNLKESFDKIDEVECLIEDEEMKAGEGKEGKEGARKGQGIDKAEKVSESVAKALKFDNDSSIPTMAKFKNLWQNKFENNINLYSVEYYSKNVDVNITECAVQREIFSFKFQTLKEFSNPQGVFIIIQSNFTPPY